MAITTATDELHGVNMMLKVNIAEPFSLYGVVVQFGLGYQPGALAIVSSNLTDPTLSSVYKLT